MPQPIAVPVVSRDLQRILAWTFMVIGIGSTAVLLFDSSSDLATAWDTYFIPFNSVIYFISGAMIAFRPSWFVAAVLFSAYPSMLYQQGVFFWSIQFPDPVSYYSAASAGSFFPMLYVVLFIALPERATRLAALHCLLFYLQFALHSWWLTETPFPEARAAAEAIFLAVMFSHPIYVVSLRYIIKLHQKIKLTHQTGLHEKADFLAMLSHELKNMLQTLVTTVDTLQLRLRAPAEQKILERIGIATEQLQFCLRDAAEMANLENPQMPVRYVDFDFPQLLGEIKKQWQPLIESKGLTFSISCADAPATLYCDRERLQQILGNLIGNALKYTVTGGIELNVYHDLAKNQLAVAVKDTGIGIPAAQQENIFKPYFRLQHALSEQCSGSGLGLAIVKTLAERLGGRIEVSSSAGEGTCFTLALPLHDTHHP